MRALTLTGRDAPPAIVDLDPVEPSAGQVRIAVEAASINGLDAFLASGSAWDMVPHSFPVVLGRDVAGTIDAVGVGVDLSHGDQVAGVITEFPLGRTGALAEAVTLSADSVTRLPQGVTPAQGAAAGLAAVTARHMADVLRLGPGDTVLVTGATGGVGTFLVQLAAATGATVLATARPGHPAELVRVLGAAHAIDYADDVAAAVREAAPGGVTAVAHLAGDAAALAQLLAPGGRLVSALAASAEQVGRSDVTVEGIFATASAERSAALLAQVASGELSVAIARTYPLDGAVQALGDFGQHKLGKLVVEPAAG
jgi:NADPH:quinone reductase-like Zn-dependent oxidoreductase